MSGESNERPALAAIGHELRNVLATIRGHAQLARRRLRRLDQPAALPLARHLDRITERTDAAAALVDDLDRAASTGPPAAGNGAESSAPDGDG